MKRDFLKNLGIEDKDIIDKILDENSADIGRAKGELDTYKAKVTNLETENEGYKNEIATLKTQVGDTAALNQKITQLESDLSNKDNELNTKVTEIKKNHAIEGKIRDAEGLNIKAIMALLDESKITYENEVLGGIDEQLDTLKTAENSSMLFGKRQSAPPAGTHLNTPPNGGNGGTPPTSKSLAEAVAKALKN